MRAASLIFMSVNSSHPPADPPGSFLVWLMVRLSKGEKLTRTAALNQALVRDAVLERPSFWDTYFSPRPNREGDVIELELLHMALLGSKLARRYKGELRLSGPGKDLLAKALRDEDDLGPPKLAAKVLAAFLEYAEPEGMYRWVALTVCQIALGANELEIIDLEDAVADIAAQQGWRVNGEPPTTRSICEPFSDTLWLLRALELWDFAEFDPRRGPVTWRPGTSGVLLLAGVDGMMRLRRVGE